MQYPILFWTGFHVFILGLLALDFWVFHKKNRSITFKRACVLSGFWIAIALAFNAFLYLHFDATVALQFLTGYVIEKSLSVDNLFLFLVIFTHFKVSALHQHKILFWGILGVLFFRITLILLGITLINLFHWTFYLFGGLLLLSGLKLGWQKKSGKDVTQNRFFSTLKKWLPTTSSYRGDRFFLIEKGKWKVTPLFLVLLMIESTDVVLALDSIPAVFAVTRDPFIIYTSNILAVLGLRSLYFVVATSLVKLRYLTLGLALILVFIGSKMLLSDVIEISVLESLAVIGAILVVVIGFSLRSVRSTPQ